MPIYEYICEECGDRSESLQGFNDPPLTECAKCAGALRKLLSAPAFQLKGTGWYVTDYARKDSGDKKEKKEESSTSSASSESSDSSSKSESSSSKDSASTA